MLDALSTLRDHFPMVSDNQIYLDSAATAFTPQVVIDAMTDFYSNRYGTVNRAVYEKARVASELYHQARIQVQHLLGAAEPEEIIFTRGTTASLNLLASSFGQRFIRPGDAIVISEIEHHSNIVPWQMLCEQKEAVLRIVPVTDSGELIFEEFLRLLDKHVKLVSLAHVSNVLGTIHPVKKIIDATHDAGALICLDGAQAAPHLPINVQELDVDFYAFSGHKLYGPTGIGVLYGKRHLLEQMPPIEGGGDMIDQVTLARSTYAGLPTKFEAGTPMTSQAIGLGAAADFLQKIGMEQIARFENELLAYATKRLKDTPVTLLGTAPEKGAILSFTVPGVHPLDLATLLDCRGVSIRSGHHCSQPTMERFGVTACARASFGIYNTFEEIDKFISLLASVLNDM